MKEAGQRKVEGRNKLPRNWPDFLSDSANKEELFTFLAKKIIEFISCAEGFTTLGPL